MDNIVGVIKGTDKLKSFDELLKITGFDDTLNRAFEKSGKSKSDFKIIIKPNMMVFVNPKSFKALVTDKELVERLVDRILKLGFTDISVCEAQNDVGTMFKGHNVQRIAELIGYKPGGRYKIVNLSEESLTCEYVYKKKGEMKKWKDKVGKSWQEADFRITFPKCKTHEHDWMTLGVKNIYGCFPPADKVWRYHIKHEIWTVTARSLLNFPVHFSIVDAWVGSDGFQGYKISNPQDLKMLFGGADAVAVDMEVFKRAGLAPPFKSHFLKKAVEQLNNGKYPEYVVKGDQKTKFSDICKWNNIDDETVKGIDCFEEVYAAWPFINMKMVAEYVDFDTFPPRNFVYRLAVKSVKKNYRLFMRFEWYRRLYEREEE